jgi:hypothetical protein
LRTFRVTAAHVVTAAVRVAEEGCGHA